MTDDEDHGFVSSTRDGGEEVVGLARQARKLKEREHINRILAITIAVKNYKVRK